MGRSDDDNDDDDDDGFKEEEEEEEEEEIVELEAKLVVVDDVVNNNNNNNDNKERDEREKRELSLIEKRLRETQKVLVKERRQREITEAVLEETTKALDSVRRISIYNSQNINNNNNVLSSVNNNNNNNSNNNNKRHHPTRINTVGKLLRLSNGKGAEETIESLMTEVERLREELVVTSLKYDEQDAELAATKQQLRAKEAYIKDRKQSVVEIKVDIREVTNDEQIEFIDKTREVLRAAVHSSLQIEELKKLDRKRTQALSKLVECMQMQRDALQLKLNDLGFKDTTEDDALQEAMLAKKFGGDRAAVKEEPVKTPSGKTFYVTRIKSSIYERIFGVHI